MCGSKCDSSMIHGVLFLLLLLLLLRSPFVAIAFFFFLCMQESWEHKELCTVWTGGAKCALKSDPTNREMWIGHIFLFLLRAGVPGAVVCVFVFDFYITRLSFMYTLCNVADAETTALALASASCVHCVDRGITLKSMKTHWPKNGFM